MSSKSLLEEISTKANQGYNYLKGMVRGGSSGVPLGLVVFLVSVTTVLGMIWFMRPWFQDIWYMFRYKLIGTLCYAILTGIAYYGWKRLGQTEYKNTTRIAGLIVIVLLAITAASPVITGTYTGEDMSAQTIKSTSEYSNLSKAPNVPESNPRILTMEGARTEALSSFNIPTHTVGDGDLVMYKGKLAVSFPVVPEGPYKSLTRPQKGAIIVPINTANPDVVRIKENYKCGLGTLVTDNAHFQTQKDYMNTELLNSKTVPISENETVTMFLGVQHSNIRIGFDNYIPMPYTVPQPNGVYIVKPDSCSVEKLSMKEARNDPRFDGKFKQQFYPYNLMRQEVIATNLVHGYWNQWFGQDDQKTYPDTPSIQNQLPYTLVYEDGSYGQVLTMEGIGDGSGVYEVYVGNGRTGEKTKYIFKSPKKGPSYAADAMITHDAEKFGKGKLAVNEVYPVFKNGQLWYQVNAVQGDTGIFAFTGFYNPETKEYFKAYTDEQVKHFYSTSEVKQYKKPDNRINVPNNNTNKREINNPSMWVKITNESNDTPYTVPVGPNEEVTITQEKPTNSTTTTTEEDSNTNN